MITDDEIAKLREIARREQDTDTVLICEAALKPDARMNLLDDMSGGLRKEDARHRCAELIAAGYPHHRKR